MPQLTEKQECILKAARRWPHASTEDIADHCDTSKSYVTETLNNFGDPKDMGGDIFW